MASIASIDRISSRFPMLAAAASGIRPGSAIEQSGAPAPKALNWFVDAVSALELGRDAGQIPSPEFKESKQVLSRAFSAAWAFHVQEPFFYRGAWKNLPEAVNELDCQIGVPVLHRASKLLKRVNDSESSEPSVQAMRGVAQEAVQIEALINETKPLVVMMNRELTQEERLARVQAENPNKTIRTCACCARGIAVTPHLLMAHHGYERPAEGYQTTSCMGVSYLPLEVSSSGLQALISLLQTQHDSNKQALLAAHTLTTLTVLVDLPYGRKAMQEISSGDPRWPKTLAQHTSRLISEIESSEVTLVNLKWKLSRWVQSETETQLRDARLRFEDSDADSDGNHPTDHCADVGPAP